MTYGESGWIVCCPHVPHGSGMIYFFRLAGDTRTCETRLESDGPRFELIITEGRESHVERFDDAMALYDRQAELRRTWSMHGWRTIDPVDEYDEEE